MNEDYYNESDIVKDFRLPCLCTNNEEKECSLKELSKDKHTILYFYPKDNTYGCTKEAQDFRDSMDYFKEKFVVCGISPDSIESHKRFKQKHDLNFYLLSDKEKTIMKKFNAFGEKKMYGKVRMGVIRSTFILDKDLKIVKSWRNVRAKGHVEKIIEWINKNI